MQVNTKKIDRRNFVEIYSSLPFRSPVKAMLTDAICSKLEVSRQTVYFWGTGKTAPHWRQKRRIKTIADCVESVLGIVVIPDNLFPVQKSFYKQP